MKALKILLIAFAPLIAFSQSSVSTLTNQNNTTILGNKMAPVPYSNMYQGIINSYANLLGSYSNPSWITSFDWSKITGMPTFGSLAFLNTINNSNWSGTALSASNLANTAVTPGSYTNGNFTVDAQGRLISASNGSSGSSSSGSNGYIQLADGLGGFTSTSLLQWVSGSNRLAVGGGATSEIVMFGTANSLSSVNINSGTGATASSMTLLAGNALSGCTNCNGGNFIVSSGAATGSGTPGDFIVKAPAEVFRIRSTGSVVISNTPTNDETQIHVLTRDNSSGEVKTRTMTSGTYTPTIVNSTNVNSSSIPQDFIYRYDGNIVEIFGTIDVYAATSGTWGNVIFTFSQPPGYVKVFNDNSDVIGIMSGVYLTTATTPISGIIEAQAVGVALKCTFTSTNPANSYRIKIHATYIL